MIGQAVSFGASQLVWQSDLVPVADLVALGAVVAVGACGGPIVPFRGGRIDATEAGPSGVCEPETDLKTTLSSFLNAGFNQQDAIGLTACGHSMGGYLKRKLNFNMVPELITASQCPSL